MRTIMNNIKDYVFENLVKECKYSFGILIKFDEITDRYTIRLVDVRNSKSVYVTSKTIKINPNQTDITSILENVVKEMSEDVNKYIADIEASNKITK